MCDMCNGMTRKQVEAKADRQIRDHGRVVIFVEPDRMSQPFAYTVGFSRIGHPEFISVRGLNAERQYPVAQRIFRLCAGLQ